MPMGRCARHPQTESRWQCLKRGIWMCEECLGCRDPALYCTHRSACLVWYLEKRVGPSDAESRDSSTQEGVGRRHS